MGRPWDGKTQGQFVTSLCRDNQGRVFVGTEDQGVWRFDPQAPAGRQYTHYTSKDGLGDDKAYALVCDWKGRVWAGTLNHGVSVFNGQTWKNYDPLTGPLGSHVTALAVCPTDGDIFIASEAGIARVGLNREKWTYYTRADGLPSDQISALAFDAKGRLYAGTQCDGLAVGSDDDGYKTWRVVPGPTALPYKPTGDGLPSCQVNAVLVGRDGTVYVGTRAGLASSADGGKTWHFLCGEEWAARARGAAHLPPPLDNSPGGPRLLEDEVTCLAEGAAGQIVVGHQTRGYEVITPQTGVRLWPPPVGGEAAADPTKPPAPEFVTALLSLPGQPGLVGTYGQGLLQPDAANAATVPAVAAHVGVLPTPDELPRFPDPAPTPDADGLAANLAQIKAFTATLPAGGVSYLGADWDTQGRWVGRYGRQYAVLCAASSPRDHYIVSENRNYVIRTTQYTLITDSPYSVFAEMGPHCTADDHLRHWMSRITSTDPRAPYDPMVGTYRESSWDDHGETYSPDKEGPDVWVTVGVPAGLHRVSFYFFNNDGHKTGQWNRDYLIQAKTFGPVTSDAEAGPDLARARVEGFEGGVYERFLVRGPTRSLFRLNRNNSFNMMVSGVFLDRLPEPGTSAAAPAKSSQTLSSPKTAVLTSAQALWTALDDADGVSAALPYQHRYRLLAYRAASQAGAPETLLREWRASLPLSTPADQKAFDRAMAQAWQTHLKTKYTADKPYVFLSK